MDLTNLKTCTIKENELVQMFGTDKQKKSYEENGRFIGANKTSLLNKVSRYCTIKDNGDKTYRITKVYDHPLPSNFNKMNKSLYQYIVPLILNSLVHGHDEHNSIDITVGKWAREINMVNQNYNLIKHNREGSSEELNLNIDYINEFYDKADHMIGYYIENALEYLKSAGLIIWREVNRITVEESDGKAIIDENCNIEVNVSLSSHQASREEMEFYSQCVEIADKEAKIENASERYYSKKAAHFQEALKRELYKRKIKYVYKTYEAYYIHLDRCQALLKQFGNFSSKKFISKFNEEFSNMMLSNAELRFDKNEAKYLFNRDDYLLSFEDLCKITIDSKAYSFNKIIEQKSPIDDYTVTITDRKDRIN